MVSVRLMVRFRGESNSLTRRIILICRLLVALRRTPACADAALAACSLLELHSKALRGPIGDAHPTSAKLRKSCLHQTHAHDVSAQITPPCHSWSASSASVAPSTKPTQLLPGGPKLTSEGGPNQDTEITLKCGGRYCFGVSYQSAICCVVYARLHSIVYLASL